MKLNCMQAVILKIAYTGGPKYNLSAKKLLNTALTSVYCEGKKC